MDRNFPGVPRIAALLGTGGHVLIRVKSDIRLPRIGAFAPDGSYLATISGGGITLTVRVIEYHVTLANTSALTSLADHAPTCPDQDGDYPIPVPGTTVTL